ncbi:MAG: TusE/DsrC/DsvC family sulfur relay protein [Thiobacillus sp.]|nr:TusE/DsrC/DsvC family sulfur relay protein [Thiobacillus sp.]
MNNAESIIHHGEIPIYDAVKYLSKEEVEETVRRNAAAMNFDVTDEHMNVIHSLVEHYRQDCKTRDCLAAHEHMRFLEEAYEFKGGSKYLYMLFDAVPGARGVLVPIHELAGLPSLRLDTDKGFGTSF